MTDLINTPSQSETAEDKTPGAETSVAELYERCIKAFRLLPAISGADPSRAVRLDDADTTRVDHGYERLNTWGELSKANLRVGAPDSLDDTLRNNVNIKAPVTSTLLRLEEVLRQALPLSQETEGDTSPDLVSVTGTEGSDEGETQHRNQRLSVLLQHITDQIDSLFQQLPILREPPLESRGVSDLDGAEGRTYSDKVASWVNDEEEEENHAGLDLEHQRTESPEPTDEERGRPRRQTLFADEQGQAWPLFQSPPASIGGSEGTTEPEPAESSESRFKVPDRAEEGVWGYLFMLYSDELGTRPIPLRWRDSENREGIALPLEKSAEQGLERNCTGDGLPQGGYLIGRHPECDIVIADPTISNRHCLIFNKSKDDQMVAVVMDMSSNGTFVNETSLGRNQQRDLEDKDEISITSKHRFVFRYSENLQNRGGVFSQQYTVLHKVGKGHFAEVYLCVEKATGSRYAVKIIQRDNNTKMDELDAEMAILNSLNHPNVQHTKASFVEARAVYLVMEYAGQGELFDHIVKKTKLSEAETRALFRQLFKAVEYLHDRNIAHRDIKPENIMIADKNLSHVWIVDFGLAKVVGDDEKMTTLCGTLSYVAPEILASKRQYDKAVDIWSLGVVMYICLCGFPPFSDELYCDDFPYTLSQQIRSGRFEYPSPSWDSVSDSAIDLIDNMLVVDPTKRYSIKHCMSHPWLNEGEAHVLAKVRAPERQRTLLSTTTGGGRLGYTSHTLPVRGSIHEDS